MRRVQTHSPRKRRRPKDQRQFGRTDPFAQRLRGERMWVATMILLHVKKHFPARATEWIVAAMLTTLGLIFLRPEPTFALSPSYVGLARLATESTWGWGCVIIGGIRIIALIINGAWVPSTYHLRSITAMLSCFVWFQLSLGLFASNTASAGLALFPWLVVLDIVSTYRVARDLRLSKHLVIS